MIKVRIKTAGRYMDDNLRARNCAAGEVLETREWYGMQLVADGLVVNVEPVEKTAPAKSKKPAKGKAAAPKKPSGPAGNPFLE